MTGQCIGPWQPQWAETPWPARSGRGDSWGDGEKRSPNVSFFFCCGHFAATISQPSVDARKNPPRQRRTVTPWFLRKKKTPCVVRTTAPRRGVRPATTSRLCTRRVHSTQIPRFTAPRLPCPSPRKSLGCIRLRDNRVLHTGGKRSAHPSVPLQPRPAKGKWNCNVPAAVSCHCYNKHCSLLPWPILYLAAAPAHSFFSPDI